MQLYAVPFCNPLTGNSNRRQFGTVPTSAGKKDLINYIETILGGKSDGDWYRVDTSEQVDLVMGKVEELGGISYNLPVA